MEKEAVDQLLQGMKQLQEEMKIVRQGQEETALRLERSAGRKELYMSKKRGKELQPGSISKQLVADKMATAMACVEKVDAKSSLSEKRLGLPRLDLALKEKNEDIFSSGMWPLLSNLEDPELRRLAQALPATVLKSRADSNSKKYLGAYRRWKVWADARQGVPSFPVKEVHLVLYTQHLSESTGSKAAVEEAVHALSWLHGLAGLQPLGGLPLVQTTLEGLKRTLARPKVRKEPITADML